MSWLQLKLTTESALAESLSNQLSEQGAVAVTFGDAADQPIFEPDCETTPLWEQTVVTALFTLDVDIEKTWMALQKSVSANVLATRQLDFVGEKNWLEDYKQDWHPLKFGNNLWICPSWKTVPDKNAIIVELDPGMAFGTGTHATTALCLEWLEANCKDINQLIDYGCGSGILAIAAVKLGAKQVIAVDNDPQALQASVENAKRNQIAATTLLALLPEQVEAPQADVLIANILAKPLLELAEKFSTLLKPGGHLVLSGILQEQTEQVLQAYAPWFQMSRPLYKEEWARLEGIRKEKNFFA